jgi:hypothetical protein
MILHSVMLLVEKGNRGKPIMQLKNVAIANEHLTILE